MDVLRILLIAITIVCWGYTFIYPIKTIKMVMKISNIISEHPKLIWVSVGFSIVCWALYIVAFGWKATLAISIIGYILGFCRGYTVKEELLDTICPSFD